MTNQKQKLSKKEKLNKLILEGNLVKALWTISLPIIIFNVFKALFQNIDSFFLAGVNQSLVKTQNVALDFLQYSKSIKNIIDAIGTCLGIAGITLIAREIGKYKSAYSPQVRRIASSFFVLLISISIFIACIMIGFARPFCNNVCKLKSYELNNPEKNTYIATFIVQMLGTILVAINVFFLGTERIVGKLKKIFILNCLMMSLKIGLSCLIFYSFDQKNNLGLEIASILAYTSITLVAFTTLLNKKNPFFLNFQDFSLNIFLKDKHLLKNIIKLSTPLMLGKMLYEFGRLWTLWMMNSSDSNKFLWFKGFGQGTIGTIGITDSIVGLFFQISFSLKEGQLMIVSENLGNKNFKRAVKTLIIASLSNLFMFIITYFFLAPNANFGLGWGEKLFLWSKNLGKTDKNVNLPQEFKNFLFGGLITTGLITTQLEIISTFLIANKQPKYDLFLNFGRVFLFRIPFLYILRNNLFQGEQDYHVYSWANFISNCIMLICMSFLCFCFVCKTSKNKKRE